LVLKREMNSSGSMFIFTKPCGHDAQVCASFARG
jgi:hypothetical protein